MKMQGLMQMSNLGQFTHGNDAYRYTNEIKADFSTNTWYLGPHPKVIQLLQAEIDCVANYPQLHGESLTEQLADNWHVSSDQIVLCNGTAEAIYLIAQAYQKASSRIVTPTFSEYEHACQIFEHHISYCGAGFIAESMNTPEGLMWLCNPNNPTGQVFGRDVLLSIIKQNPQTLFVIDEAYADFCMEEVTLSAYIGKYKNLLILKSMTKNYCLPGLRLGYVMGHQSVVQKIALYRPPWSVNSLALKAGEFSLKNPLISEDSLLQYLSLSRELMLELNTIDQVEVQGSSTGFFLLKTPMKAAELKHLLVEKYGLLIRDASNFRTLSEYHIRVASLTRASNALLVNAFNEIFA
ncbi:histidinol-phosphate transaminase [Carboxylicivirga sp. M1479]|uniref:pyridoxal phosphate-dependent aminotransferase n=1 Tax=Carboxylicivirga sp. M1479 TaxID=2594476 RepID=UPI00163DA836|nr:aminotransferase class I/II-fold pyridoxal phosphate-dependent enzyme [Carboxylicivirga sp. M1479]